ncbi:MAG TPA: 16S rRNA (adenine(1518)-N(6)/adenine(1519)-N(6))-dimethyltransferase RsmA [Gammaproteobacteria bacterium]|nr:16S rRNA (adenine(1518)-N(6)/adenine(1519)-N(6))-dimethyltransferase RsmA [Gammaproteobacteria bacterium]
MSEHRARKRFGQHFLHDRNIINRILLAIAPQPHDCLVEIGPGLGAITLPLLERCGALIAVELDRDVIPRLEAAASGKGSLRIVQGDALKIDFRTLVPTAAKLRLIGNLPYNISTPLLFHILEQADAVHDMHFMLQKEVVQRMAAKPGGREYGRLTVMLALRCRVEPLFNIGAGAFSPPPKVESSFVRLTPHRSPPFPVNDPSHFARLVSQAFSHRRKTLRNALQGMADEALIRAAGIDPGARPETLAAADYARLSNLAELAGVPAHVYS